MDGRETTGETLGELRGLTLRQIEAAAIRASFARHNGNRARMVEELGVSKATLLRHLDALGLRKPRNYLFGSPQG